MYWKNVNVSSCQVFSRLYQLIQKIKHQKDVKVFVLPVTPRIGNDENPWLMENLKI